MYAFLCTLQTVNIYNFDSDNLYVQELINLSLKYVSRLTGSTTLTFKLLLILFIYKRKGAKKIVRI